MVPTAFFLRLRHRCFDHPFLMEAPMPNLYFERALRLSQRAVLQDPRFDVGVLVPPVFKDSRQGRISFGVSRKDFGNRSEMKILSHSEFFAFFFRNGEPRANEESVGRTKNDRYGNEIRFSRKITGRIGNHSGARPTVHADYVPNHRRRKILGIRS